MGVDRGLYERIQQLKEENKIGIQRAWNYIKTEAPYEQLRSILVKRIGDPSKVPSIDVLSQFCSRINRMVIKEYSESDKPIPKDIPYLDQGYDYASPRAQQFMQDILEGMIQPRANPRKWLASCELLQRALSSKELVTTLYRQLCEEATSKEDTNIKNELFGLSFGAPLLPSAFVQAVLERTLHRLDTERHIAYQHIRQRRFSGESADQTIDSCINEISDCIDMLNMLKDETNILAKTTEELISKCRSDPSGCTDQEDEEILKRESQYTLRAITRNRRWLKEMLSR